MGPLTRSLFICAIILCANQLLISGAPNAFDQENACSVTEEPMNGFQDFSSDPIMEGTIVSYDCHYGYVLVGAREAVCEGGRWSETKPKCVIPCKTPPEPKNGRRVFDANSNNHQSKTTYWCNPGFELVGPSKITCQEDGTWSHSQPICIPAATTTTTAKPVNYCPELAKLENGYHSLENGHFIEKGEEVVFVCSAGYDMDGSPESICQEDQTWSHPPPTCVPNHYCMMPRNSSELHRTYILTDTVIEVGTRVTFMCLKRYKMVGHPEAECSETGEWTRDEPTCEFQNACKKIDKFTNGFIEFEGDDNKIEVGTYIGFSCNDGYKIVGDDVLECLDNGSWSYAVPECHLNHYCPDLKSLENGFHNHDNFLIVEGTVINYQCKGGFQLVGVSTTECLGNQKWSNPPPYCNPKHFCRPPRTPENGEFTSDDNPIMAGSIVTFRCNKGFQLQGDEMSQCLEDATWSAVEPECVQVHMCQPPEHFDKGFYEIDTDMVVVHTIIYFECEVGYTLVGSEFVTCVDFDEWNQPFPICKRRGSVCNTFPKLTNGYIEYEDETIVELTTARFSCDENYVLKGEESSTCLKFGKWSAPLPKCEPMVRCFPPQKIQNGKNNYNYNDRKDIVPGTKVLYSCNLNYHMDGSQFIECLPNGIWSHPPPSCSLIKNAFCVDPGHPRFGKRKLSVKDLKKIMNGAEIFYLCNSGFKLVGERRAICLLGGVWSHDPPTCEKHRFCPDPGTPEFSKRIEESGARDSLSVGSKIRFTCENGSQLKGTALTICLSSFEWSAATPQCIVDRDDFKIGCTTPANLIEIPKLGYRRLMCPANCSSTNNSVVHGDKIYSKLSSVCLAAMHSGLLSKNGGKVTILNGKIQGQYNGSESNGIISTSLEDRVESFTLRGPTNCAEFQSFQLEMGLKTPFKTPLPLINGCCLPPNITRGHFRIYPSGSKVPIEPIADKLYSNRSTIEYHCENRFFYSLLGPKRTVCLGNNIWSDETPTCVQDCAKTTTKVIGRVVNGFKVKPGEYPWQVGIAKRANKKSDALPLIMLCGGSLISEKWVITAAHCVYETHTGLRIPAKDFRLYFGKSFRDFSKDDDNVVVREVNYITEHPHYDHRTNDNDIALMHLKEIVTFNLRIVPICLPDDKFPHITAAVNGTTGTATGWGLTNLTAETIPEILLGANLTIISREQCQKTYDVEKSIVTESMLCAGGTVTPDGKFVDVCNGDSGGPFAVQKDGRWFLEGIVSWGSNDGCGVKNKYSVFSNVTHLMPWIKEQIY